MKNIFYILVFFLGLSISAQNLELFDKANAAYADGNYREAITQYNRILENGEVSAAVHFNMGNAYYKMNEIAPSIYHYEKALELDPEDEDIQTNLEFARTMAVDGFQPRSEKGFWAFLERNTKILSSRGWGWVAIFCMVLFAGFFLAYYFSNKTNLKRIFFGAAIFVLLLSLTATGVAMAKENRNQDGRYGIIFSEEVEVRGEPGPRGPKLFALHEGTKVRVVEEFQGWYEIQLPTGSQGWIRTEALKIL